MFHLHSKDKHFNTLVDCINWIDEQDHTFGPEAKLIITENETDVLIVSYTSYGRFWNSF